ncbi:MAG: DTW domain-containing protein, partial [Deltaproteobacteria bacterium]|nr:DTW domain-containing protein [Deltaproteobacteria bacterium]
FDGNPELQAALSDPERPAALLYPGAGAQDLSAAVPKGPITLVVVDGTWAQARQVVRRSPALGRLPRYCFAPAAPSEYDVIRHEPRPDFVSTLEALAHGLGVLEGTPERFQALLAPLRAMVAMQVENAVERNGGLTRHKRRWADAPPIPRVPAAVTRRTGDLVCVVGEANAWSWTRPGAYPDELVHWLACRIGTGERFEAVLAPRNPLAPSTPVYVGLSAERLAAGATLADFQERWRSFIREQDVVCFWGRFVLDLARDAGGWLPQTRVNLRKVAGDVTRRSPGTMAEYCARIGVEAPALGEGRGGQRLGQLAAIARTMSRMQRSP